MVRDCSTCEFWLENEGRCRVPGLAWKPDLGRCFYWGLRPGLHEEDHPEQRRLFS